MLLIKTHVQEGQWELYEAECDVRYLGSHIEVAVPAESNPSWWEDDRFPTDDVGVIHCHTKAAEIEGKSRFVRWIKWRDADGVMHFLVTEHPVFICNDRGDTIEAIR